MSYRWSGKIWLIGLILAALLGVIGYSTGAAQLKEVNIPVVITGGIPKEWNLGTYSARHFTVHFQRGDEIWLSANADGTGDIEVHPSLEIKVIHPNGTIAGRVIPGGKREPQDITPMFAVGKNDVTVTLFPSFPDLEPKALLGFDPLPPVEAGEEVKVSTEAMNTGMSSADCFFTAFSYRPMEGGESTEFDKVIICGLEGGRQREVMGIFDTTDVKPGKYQICVDLDSDDFVEELDETNNSYCTSLPFEVIEPKSGTSSSSMDPEAAMSLPAEENRSDLFPKAISSGSNVSSSSLWVVRKTKTSAPRLIRTMTRETAQLQRELARTKASWNTSIISRKLKRAFRYSSYASYRPRLGEMAKTLLDNASDLIIAIDFSQLIERAKGGLPELRGEIEALIMLNEAAEEPAKEALDEIASLHRFLCGLDPAAPDCEEILPITPIGRTWSQIKDELLEVIDLLSEARLKVPDPEAGKLIREAESLLPSPLEEVEELWRQVNEHLTRIGYQIRLMQRALRRGSRYSLGAQDQGHLSFELYPNPIRTGFPIEVAVRDIGVESIELQIFALDGRPILDRATEGNYLQFSPLDDRGRLLANGVYLYVVTACGWDGSAIQSEVRKLVILR